MKHLLAAALLVPTLALAQVPEPADFHGEPYKSPVPATLAGAVVIDDAQARALHDAAVPFLDVLPRQTRPKGLPEGTVWVEKPHASIPGAVWLPNTGYDRLNPTEEARLRDGLARAAPDKVAPVVIFCRADCWMSWNAARRAIGWGYSGVHWYPGGTDGWSAAGGSLVTVQPVE
ncbi:PQQ-dependent catabolism-associated CXXCW motif protein [Paracoccus sp. p3-h83]|uniref:PQQ-dependent catabolism-associated CXXCW motif protein n=1 Tax=Paracoccus sp. p3-h83 TaxID=3342805 RepID=UPI0035B7220C